MAIISGSLTRNSTNNQSSRDTYLIKEFLKSASWTVDGSSDGATGGMDAVDRIVAETTMTDTDSWIVLGDPTGTLQILFAKVTASSSEMEIRWDPEGAYTGGGASTEPTSATSGTILTGVMTTTVAARIHISASDSAPVGFVFNIKDQMDLVTTRYGMALIPLDDTLMPAGAGAPYVLYSSDYANLNEFDHESLTSTESTDTQEHCEAQLTSGGAPTNVAALRYRTNTVDPEIPGGMQSNADGEDQQFPVMFVRGGSNKYIGITDWMRWNGVNRGTLYMLDGMSRATFDDVTFPWDGATIPNP